MCFASRSAAYWRFASRSCISRGVVAQSVISWSFSSGISGTRLLREEWRLGFWFILHHMLEDIEHIIRGILWQGTHRLYENVRDDRGNKALLLHPVRVVLAGDGRLNHIKIVGQCALVEIGR